MDAWKPRKLCPGILGVVQAMLLISASKPLSSFMGVTFDSPMLHPAHQYLKLRSLGAPAVLLSLAMQGVFRGFKNTKTHVYATDALKLLAILRQHVPRAAATVGAWLNIFQFLILMSICTNCSLLLWLYDEGGKWKVEPGLAAILIMEHVLLLIKFGFSRLVPEEPAWVRAN